MYAYIKGELTIKTPAFVVLETGGVGYKINITLHTFSKIEKEERTRLWIYQHVKEDSLTLYGFYSEAERAMFILLISVSGIGPNTGRLILSSMTVDELTSSLVHEDVAAFKRIKGVGPKTAKRIILDLKDKVTKDKDLMAVSAPAEHAVFDEALSALLALGFKRMQVKQALTQVHNTNPHISKTEDFIRFALKKLS